MAAISNSGCALEHASERLRDVAEIVVAALLNSGYALEFASERLRGDAGIVVAAVSNQGDALRWASPDLKDDSCIVHLETDSYPMALEWASSRIKDDEEIVRPLVGRGCGLAFEHVSIRLRSDYPMIMLALEKTWKTPYYSGFPAFQAQMEPTIRHVDINKLAVHLSSVPEGTFELMSLIARHCGIDDTYTLLREINLSLFFSNLAVNEQHVRVPDRKRRKIVGC